LASKHAARNRARRFNEIKVTAQFLVKLKAPFHEPIA